MKPAKIFNESEYNFSVNQKAMKRALIYFFCVLSLSLYFQFFSKINLNSVMLLSASHAPMEVEKSLKNENPLLVDQSINDANILAVE